METFTWIVLSIIAIATALYRYVTSKYRYWSDRGIAGPAPKPFVGNILTVASESSADYEIKWAKNFGKVYGTYVGFEPTLTVMDPDLIKQMMVKDFHLFVNRRKFNYYHELLSQNLFSLADDRWKVVRTIATPTFSSGKLRRMYPLMNRCVDKLLSCLNRLTSDEEQMPARIETKQVIIRFTLDVIAATAFATETNANDDRNKSQQDPFLNYANKLLQISKFRLLALFAFPRWINDLLNFKLDVDPESYEYFVSFLKNILKQRKSNPTFKRNDLVQLLLDAAIDEKELAHSNYDKLSVSTEQDEYSNDQRDTNRESADRSTAGQDVQRKLTENDIVAQCIIFFAAGYETTASAISYVLYELATNPVVQERLLEELNDKLSNYPESKRNSEEFHEKVMNECPYLDAVIKETLRKYPPLARVERRVSVEGYKLGGVQLFKDQLVEVPVYAIHHSEEYYPEPERFDPERFLPENKHLLVPYTYLPFGTGPRNCVGMRFAYQVAKLCLSQIVPRFRFQPAPDTPVPLQFLKGSFFLLPVSMPIAISRR